MAANGNKQRKPLSTLLTEVMAPVTGRQVAKIIGKTEPYVAQIRSGTQCPTDETITKIAMALVPERLAELLLAAGMERLRSKDFKNDPKGELKDAAVEAMESLRPARTVQDGLSEKRKGRTLNDFPEAFYPLVVVTGDRREERGSYISVADFGAYTASPADTRWLLNLGLGENVVKQIDKTFLLLPKEKLIELFAETNLLVIGSPAANHLARLVNKTAVFRFNYSKESDEGIDEIIKKARQIEEEHSEMGRHAILSALTTYQAENINALRARMRSLFTGGILDPTHPTQYVAAAYHQIAAETQLDFGIVTFAENPYYEEKCKRENRASDYRYVTIMAAGIHHPGTAHAVRLLGREKRDDGILSSHPYGGVLRVFLDLNLPFAERVERSDCDWEDVADKEREDPKDQRGDLLRELKAIEDKLRNHELTHLALSPEQASGCLRLVENL